MFWANYSNVTWGQGADSPNMTLSLCNEFPTQKEMVTLSPFFHQDFQKTAESSRMPPEGSWDWPPSQTMSAMVFSQMQLESEVMALIPLVRWKQVPTQCHKWKTWKNCSVEKRLSHGVGVPLTWLQAQPGHHTRKSDSQPVNWQCPTTSNVLHFDNQALASRPDT